MNLRQSVAASFLIGAVLINVPYTLLVMTFDYPGILREPAGQILEGFAAGGSALIATWMAFAWVGMPLLFGVSQLPQALYGDAGSALARTATVFGVVGLLAQLVGLLRWVFVVPILAQVYLDPAADEAIRAAARVSFAVVHAYGGVVLGEHIGQLFTIGWMVLLSIDLLRTRVVSVGVAVLGLGAGAVYALAQGELMATVVPGFPVWDLAGLVGSLLWLAFLITLGGGLLRGTPSRTLQG